MRTKTTRGLVGVLVAMVALAAAVMLPQAASAAYEITGFEAPIIDANSDEETQAGAHPYGVVNEIRIKEGPTGFSTASGHVKDVIVDLPPGLLGNPQLLPTCNSALLRLNQCPLSSRIASFFLHQVNGVGATAALYNMEPAPGNAAQFASSVLGQQVVFEASVRPDDYGIRMTVRDNQHGSPVLGTDLTMYGNPGALSGSGLGDVPFLTSPTYCSTETPVTKLRTNSWEHPDVWETAVYEHPQFTGCEALDYQGKFSITPAVAKAGAPSGYTVELDQQLTESAGSLATSHLKDTVVTLPEGVRINPAAGIGLSGCTPEEIGIGTDSEIRCPQSSSIGTVKIETPLLAEDLQGRIYQAAPHNNPFGSLLAIYLVAEVPERGVTLKLAGEVSLDPQTGQITTTFRDNPQQPFTKLTLQFKGGDRAVLINPRECGTHTAQGSLAPWSGNAPVSAPASFAIEGDCEKVKQFDPEFAAGSTNPVAGATTPFSLAIKRSDTDRELKTIKSIRLPEGLLGNVGSVPLCAEAQAAAGTCAEASKVGHVQAAVGAGTPLWVPEAGKTPTGVYLTGPYKGAPYGLSIKVPAQAGPFDLGTVVIRSALHVDERTTQITAGIDESRLIATNGSVTEVLPDALPRILQGIVLNQREIRVIMDREGFMVNPTDCSAQQITAELHSFDGDRVEVGDRFRAVDCASLGFAPRFNARILDKGRKSTLRSWHPRTRFAVVPRKGDANIGAARVVLPSSTMLDQANIGTTCTRAQMAERNCPEASVVGFAKAWSPLLGRAVEGPVYLAANGGVRPLPDLAAVLDGEIRVVLQGEISTRRGGGKARLQNTFRVVPDAPVSRFVLTMRGGNERGLLVNSTDLCRSKERGAAVFHGQNGRSHRLRPRIATTFRGCTKARRQVARRSAARKQARKAAVRAAARRVALR